MTCPRCRAKMQVQSHRPHKQEKWRCPNCGKIRFKRQGRKDRSRRRSGNPLD